MLVESFGTGEHDPPYPVQRIVFAAAMSEGLVLHPASRLVQAPVGDLHHMERVGDLDGMIKIRRQSGPESFVEIGRHGRDPGEPFGRLGAQPRSHIGGGVALHEIDHHVTIKRPRTR